mgnify:FL=1
MKKSCQRCFQALRIDINSEFEVLYSFLDKLPGALKPGGRAAILTFHSGEDRLVKRAFKDGKKAGLYSEISADVIRPSAEECIKNGRAVLPSFDGRSGDKVLYGPIDCRRFLQKEKGGMQNGHGTAVAV